MPSVAAAESDAPLTPIEAAKSAGLRYVTDAKPGITRSVKGSTVSFTDVDGKPVRDEGTLDRIASLVIPPAWTDVWICPSPRGHLQATGRDTKGRKQYRYHPRWRTARDETKYERMLAFGQALPAIRGRVAKDLAKPDLPRAKVVAAAVRLLETTLIRVGNQEYARDNRSFGLTTLRDRHVEIEGATIRFQFRGKSGKDHEIDLKDRRLANIVKRCRDLPGQDLFQYVDGDGARHTIESGDVNEYLREITGEDFTAKDFRTWAGTVLAAWALHEYEEVDSEAHAKRNIVTAIDSVAQRLGNTRTVCRKCYVHPAVIDAYLDGTLVDSLRQRAAKLDDALTDLSHEETAVLALLRRRLEFAAA